ncbi:hypothetical protein B0H16DRAFT_1533065 [Mycena metata]|uniref:Uncharacterized protein n=1 Tax=Mycena metata TaxID=1033252 RepID=A0AAD7JAZ8_9AGAR|nr:hypothetical protein B0H16DRAFT_1533065 [Mycena metata]
MAMPNSILLLPSSPQVTQRQLGGSISPKPFPSLGHPLSPSRLLPPPDLSSVSRTCDLDLTKLTWTALGLPANGFAHLTRNSALTPPITHPHLHRTNLHAQSCSSVATCSPEEDDLGSSSSRLLACHSPLTHALQNCSCHCHSSRAVECQLPWRLENNRKYTAPSSIVSRAR